MKRTGSRKEFEKLEQEWVEFKKDTKIDLWLYGATATMAGAAVAFAIVGIFMGYYLSGVITPVIAVGIEIFARRTMHNQIKKRTDDYAFRCWRFGITFEKETQKLAKELAKKNNKVVK